MKLRNLILGIVLFGCSTGAQAYCTITNGVPHVVGSFQLTCVNIKVQPVGGVFVVSASCSDGKGGMHSSYLSDICQPDNEARDIANIYGVLMMSQSTLPNKSSK